MDIFITLFKVLLLFSCVLLILLVLMQRPKQEGLGAAFGGGMADAVLGAGTTNFLQKATVYLAVAFFILSAGLAVLVSKKQRGEDAIPLPAAQMVEEVTTPEGVTPTAPANAPDTTAAETTPAATETAPEPAPVETGEPAPVETGEPAPVETGEPAPAETGEPAPAETSEPAPAETSEPAPAETPEPAPADGGESNQ